MCYIRFAPPLGLRNRHLLNKCLQLQSLSSITICGRCAQYSSPSSALLPLPGEGTAGPMLDKLCTLPKHLDVRCPLGRPVAEVSMDFMANGLLALGASPAMVHAVEELEQACMIQKWIPQEAVAWLTNMKRTRGISEPACQAISVVADLHGAVSINIGTLDPKWILGCMRRPRG